MVKRYYHIVSYKLFFFAILIVTSSLFLYFAGKTSYEIATYYRFSKKIVCELQDPRVVEVKSNKYFIYGTFLCDGDKADVQMEGPFPNRFAADEGLKNLQLRRQYHVWINPKTTQKGVLEKKFPFQLVISSLLLFGLIIYFLFLMLRVCLQRPD